MSAAADPAPETRPAPRPTRGPLLLGLVLALLGAGAGFGVVRMGLFGDGGVGPAQGVAADPQPIAPGAFVPIAPILVNLPGGDGVRFLRFEAQLEVDPAERDEVAALLPRVVDVLNGYLRALRVTEIEDPAALPRLRAQMLRRIQVVAGGERVRDLLIMELVVN
jgi:flagellar FliL protein